MRHFVLAVLVLLPVIGCASPPAGGPPRTFDDETEEAEVDDGHGVGHALLLYLPNRIFDVFDIVRARVRIGPGFGVSLRATELADVHLAAYTSVWVGIHGPRNEPEIPWPAGLESLATAEVSVAEASADAGFGPDYGPVEIGLGFQAAIIGVDVGVEPFEILDLVTGFVFVDPVGDDY